jgi:hypothetical protein
VLKKLNREGEKIVVLNKEDEMKKNNGSKPWSDAGVMRLVWWHV